MKEETFKFKSSTGKDIHVYKWVPDDKIIGVVQIIHGSIEHCYRYKRFAQTLTEYGYIVYGNDHIGHGKSIDTQKFYFSDNKNGIDYAVKDTYILNKIIQKQHKNKNIIVFGHSMGSFMLRKLINRTNSKIDGAIICGTGGPNQVLLNIFILLAKINIFFKF